MRVLIVTEPDDIHAVLVKLALEKRGVECELFFSADMPTKQTNSIFISTDDCVWDSFDDSRKEIQPFDINFDSIWWRRPRTPHLPDKLHKEDRPFVRNENLI